MHQGRFEPAEVRAHLLLTVAQQKVEQITCLVAVIANGPERIAAAWASCIYKRETEMES
jgi:hypothetical protein